MATRDEISGFVLAGGRSARMGRDKGSLLFGDKPLVRVAAEAAATVCGRVFLVAPAGRYPTLSLPRIEDCMAGGGPLVALLSVLRATDAEWNLALPCDMPFLTSELLRDLTSPPDTVDALVVKHAGGRALPLPGCYSVRCLAAVERAVASGDRRLDSFFDQVRLGFLRADDYGERAFVNWNSPEDMARWT